MPLLPWLPFPTEIDLGTDEAFTWRIRLELERRHHNITDAHKVIIQHVADLADAGHSQVTHAEIAATLHRGARTVRDALRRARALGLVDWTAQYEPRPGSVLRRRQANIYRRTMPDSSARLRPDVRRHDGGTPRRARKKEGFERRSPLPAPRELVIPDLLAARRAAFAGLQRLESVR